VKRQSGSHKTLMREAWPDVVFPFHDSDEIGPKMLARIAKLRSAIRISRFAPARACPMTACSW
jgi:hypothetical protein